jgi:putative DNA methylase
MSNEQIPIDTQFDEPFANQIARLEAFNKHHYRPNTYLHKWWARRCGSTFRLILKHLVADGAARDYYASGGLKGKLILDPMMGGATTLHEAMRLGANVIGADLDPIPVLQARATLSKVKLVTLEQAFHTFYRRMWGELEPYYLTKSPVTGTAVPFWYTLYGARRHCQCGAVLMVDALTLRQEVKGASIHICPSCHDVYTGDQHHCVPGAAEGKRPLVVKAIKSCQSCGTAYEEDETQAYYSRYEPLGIVGRGRGRTLFFKAVDEADRANFAAANQARPELTFDRDAFVIDRGRKSAQLIQRGVENYLDLFSSRQLLYLDRAIHHLHAFEPVPRLILGLLVSTSLEFNSMLCGYKGKNKRRSGAIRHTFSHHAYSFPYTALENNPLFPGKASGTLQKLFQARVRNGRFWANRPRERKMETDQIEFVDIPNEQDAGIEVFSESDLRQEQQRFMLLQGSSTCLPLSNNLVDAIVTDPPYYDSVQYSDLSTYFRVWLRLLLPEAAEWVVDVHESAVDPHKRDRESRYRELLTGIFMECYRVLKKENGRLIFTFHHWNPKGWAALTIALKCANFKLVNRYVVHSENPISVHINKMKSLTHDAIMVFAPVEDEVDVAWKRPLAINIHDSESFCRDCATFLGWLLTTNLTATEIEKQWRSMLK